MARLSRYMSQTSGNLSSTPRTHVKVEERTNSMNLYSDQMHGRSTHAIHSTCMYMHKHTTHTTPKAIPKHFDHVCLFSGMFPVAPRIALGLRHVHPPTLFSSFGSLRSSYFHMGFICSLLTFAKIPFVIMLRTGLNMHINREHHHLNFGSFILGNAILKLILKMICSFTIKVLYNFC